MNYARIVFSTIISISSVSFCGNDNRSYLQKFEDSFDSTKIDYKSIPCKAILPGKIIISEGAKDARICASDSHNGNSSLIIFWLFSYALPKSQSNPMISHDMMLYMCETNRFAYKSKDKKIDEMIFRDTLKSDDFRAKLFDEHCK